MERYSSFVRANAFAAALILGLLLCCHDAVAGGPKEKNVNQPTTPETLKPNKKKYQPPTPETLKIGQGMNPLSLTGPIPVGLSIVAPETSQGMWAIQTIQKISGGVTPSKSELARFATKGDINAGEALTDDKINSGLFATNVKSPSVVLELPITWTETLSQVLALGESGCPPSAAVCTSQTYNADGAIGVYSARVEVCLATSDHSKLKEVEDEDNKPIKCTTADGVLSKEGYWYDVSDNPWTYTTLTAPSESRLFSNKTNSWSWFEPQTPGTTNGTFSIPVNLPVPVNSLRVEIELGLKDPHATADKKTQQWVYSDPLPSDPYVRTDWGIVDPQNGSVTAQGGPELVVTRFAIQLPNITVLPAAFMTMKVLPYTILYRPPGDKSQGTYTTTESYGTSMTTGVSTAIDNTTAFMQSQEIKADTKISALILSIEEEDKSTSSGTTATDNNSTVGTGLVTSNSLSSVRQWTLGSSGGDPTILPAAQFVTPNTCTPQNYTANGCTVTPGETFAQEPFWEDRIVVLLNPTAELWDFNAGTTMQLLGAEDYDTVSITDLAACAQSTGKYGWTLANGSQLTPAECLDLLGLDPYYIQGQSLDPSKSNRGVGVGNGNYGGDPLNPGAAGVATSFQEIISYSSAQSTNASASYQTTVTSVTGFSWSDGMTLSASHSFEGLDLGISGGTTVTNGNQATLGTQMKVTYSASTVATSTKATQITGSFADDHDFETPACHNNPDKCYTPQVNVYIDELFGSYMFSDPAAPQNPLNPILIPHPVNTPSEPVPIEAPGAGTTKTSIAPVPMEVPGAGTTKTSITPVVSPAASNLSFNVIYINPANLLTPSKIKGVLTWSQGELRLEENGKQIFSVPPADIKDIDTNTVLGVSAGSFHILLKNGKRYDFWAASLKAPDTESIADSLKRAVH
ncbi:MAG: hypothetical protein WAO35_27385 [Terriglobia bacterium]